MVLSSVVSFRVTSKSTEYDPYVGEAAEAILGPLAALARGEMFILHELTYFNNEVLVCTSFFPSFYFTLVFASRVW